MRVLILDDEEYRHDVFREEYADWERHHVYTAETAIQTILDEPAFDVVHLDHDISGNKVFEQPGKDTGYAVACALAQAYGAKPHGLVIVHSINPHGAKAMMGVLIDKYIKCMYRPFGVK